MLHRLQRLDQHLMARLLTRRRVRLEPWMRRLTRAGGLVPSMGLVGGAAVVGAGRAAVAAAATLMLSTAGVQALKRVARRPRPTLRWPEVALIPPPDAFSFPSGHAAASLSLALGLAATLPVVLGVSVMAIAASVGYSRYWLGVHYLGDVVAGWALAVAAYLATAPLLG